MDLALAKFVEAKLPGAGRLDAAQYGMLTQACRQAKEALLGPAAAGVLHRHRHGPRPAGDRRRAARAADAGRRSPGRSSTASFPIVPRDAEPQRGARAGLHEMGLPYVSDPAITRHLAGLPRSASVGRRAPPPTAILFNGGVFQPAALRERLVEVLRHWYDTPGTPWQPLVLTNPSLDLAVAWGAAYYAWLSTPAAGASAAASPAPITSAVEADGRSGPAAAKPTSHRPSCASCRSIWKRARRSRWTKPELELALGQPVIFPLYTSTVRGDDQAGDLLDVSRRPAAAAAAAAHRPARRQAQRHQQRAGDAGRPLHRDRHAGTVVRRQGRQQSLAAGVQRPRHRRASRERARRRTTPTRQAAVTDVWPEARCRRRRSLIRAAYAGRAARPRSRRS